jgi:hypothetical protein
MTPASPALEPSGAEARSGPRVWALAVLVALPRLLVFPANQNLFGDAIARTWLAHNWLRAPHVIGSFDQGAFQYGSLHVYLLALAEVLWPSLLHAGRVVSLLAGIASTFPLYALTRRRFGVRAATAAIFGFAFWGLHIQCATTSSSEALNLLLVFAALERFEAWFATSSRPALLACALWLVLATATRYDSWLLIPLLAAVVWWRARKLWTAAWFAAAACAFAVPFMFGNWVDRGAPLYPFTYIDDFHRAWYPSEQASWGRATYRALCLVFWPGTAVVTLTPPVAFAGFAGLVRAWRTDRARWLVLLVLVPTVLYTLRSAVLGSFAPLTRFTVKEVALLLPFAWYGVEPLFARFPRLLAPLSGVTGLLCVVWAVWLGLFCAHPEGTWQTNLSPIAATSTLPPRLEVVCDWLAGNSDGQNSVLVDQDLVGYDDLIVGYFSGFAYEHQARRRSLSFDQRLSEREPSFLVRFEYGQLQREGALVVEGPLATFRGLQFIEMGGFEPPLHLYRRLE